MANRNQLWNVATGALGLGLMIYGANAAKDQHDLAEELRGRDPDVIEQALHWIGDHGQIADDALTPDRVVDATGVEHALLHVGIGELVVVIGSAALVGSAIALRK